MLSGSGRFAPDPHQVLCPYTTLEALPHTPLLTRSLAPRVRHVSPPRKFFPKYAAAIVMPVSVFHHFVGFLSEER
jgi:hypothetical protein